MNMVNSILAEDATVFHLDKRLLERFGSIGHGESTGLKLYLNINLLGETRLDGEMKRVNVSDVNHKGFKPLKDKGSL